MQKYDSQAGGGEIAVLSAKRYGTLKGRIGAWFDQRSRGALLEQAKAQTDADTASLTAQHAALDARSSAAAARIDQDAGADAAAAGAAQTGKLARMAHVHDLAQVHSILEDRLDTEKQLSVVYAKWIAQVKLQHRIVLHLIPPIAGGDRGHHPVRRSGVVGRADASRPRRGGLCRR